MNIPELKKIKSEKRYHNTTLKDDYSWVDQPDILDVLKNPNKLHPDVKKYIEENNLLTEEYFSDVKNLQKKLFNEIKSKIKLDDTSLKFKDRKYFYWSKTEVQGMTFEDTNSKLFNVNSDPRQELELDEPETVRQLVHEMIDLMTKADAPKEMFKRLNLNN